MNTFQQKFYLWICIFFLQVALPVSRFVIQLCTNMVSCFIQIKDCKSIVSSYYFHSHNCRLVLDSCTIELGNQLHFISNHELKPHDCDDESSMQLQVSFGGTDAHTLLCCIWIDHKDEAFSTLQMVS